MNRLHPFNYIKSKLAVLATEIDLGGKLNLLDLHLHSENFYQHFFNELFSWKLINMNVFKPNAEAIDLIDQTNKIIVQVSATATKKKVESALGKDLSSYSGYSFKFISISKDAASLRSNTFANPHSLVFDPQADIYDVTSILRYVTGLAVADQRRIAAFIKAELGAEVDPVKLESNLAAIINILAKEELNRDDSAVETIPFGIDKKIDHNNLDAARGIIEDYFVHHNRVSRIYTDFDKAGINKSMNVLNAIRRDYQRHQARLSDDDLFFKVVECAMDRVQESANYRAIPVEELELCVNILVVDAFARCKIFKKPLETPDAAA